MNFSEVSKKTKQLKLITNIFAELIEKYKYNNNILFALRTILKDSRKELLKEMKRDIEVDLNARRYLNGLYSFLITSKSFIKFLL